jgi:hypothetical protein
VQSTEDEGFLVSSLPDPNSRSCKNADEYIKFVALSGDWEHFDRKDTIEWLDQSGSNHCEVLYHLGDARWVLVFSPISCQLPRLVSPEESSEPRKSLDDLPQDILASTDIVPPSRELDWADGIGWLQDHNFKFGGFDWQYKVAAIVKPGELSRRDHRWRPTFSPVPIDTPPARPSPPRAIDRRDGGRTGIADLIVPVPQAPTDAGPTGNGRESKPKLRPPSEKAMMAYRLNTLKGENQDQTAKELSRHFGCRISQGSVSRYIKSTLAWLEAGNVLPKLPVMTKKPTPMDPSELERGPRLDGRVTRQRDKQRM